MAKGRTSSALQKLVQLQASTAVLITTDKNGQEQQEEIDIALLQTNDVVKIVRGARVPSDGEVVFGVSAVDESMITGESMPVTKNIGDNLTGSTVNQEGTLHMKVTRVGEDSTLSQIIRLMEEAQANKAPIQVFYFLFFSFSFFLLLHHAPHGV